MNTLPTDLLSQILQWLPFIDLDKHLVTLKLPLATCEKIRNNIYAQKIRHFKYSDREVYLIEGKRHRSDGPAVIHSNNKREWFKHGRRHNSQGPAIIYSNGNCSWYRYDKLHRIDGPAVMKTDGYCSWHYDGFFHRIGGPAVIRPDGDNDYYVYGKRIPKL